MHTLHPPAIHTTAVMIPARTHALKKKKDQARKKERKVTTKRRGSNPLRHPATPRSVTSALDPLLSPGCARARSNACASFWGGGGGGTISGHLHHHQAAAVQSPSRREAWRRMMMRKRGCTPHTRTHARTHKRRRNLPAPCLLPPPKKIPQNSAHALCPPLSASLSFSSSSFRGLPPLFFFSPQSAARAIFLGWHGYCRSADGSVLALHILGPSLDALVIFLL